MAKSKAPAQKDEFVASRRYPLSCVTEKPILDGEDGFILVGNISPAEVDDEGNPAYYVLGDHFENTDGNGKLTFDQVGKKAYTRFELLQALGYTRDELEDYAKQIKPSETAS